MVKAIEISKSIRKDLSKNWLEELEDYNLHKIFEGIYSMDISTSDKNIIICFIIYSYSPESLWLDLNKDRLDNKKQILGNLGITDIKGVYIDVISNSHDIIGECVFNFLEQLKNWKWKMVFDLLDFATKIQKFSTQETEEEKSVDKMNKEGVVKTLTQDVGIDIISKVNKEKDWLLDRAIDKRIKADNLLKEIKTEFVKTDEATQSDFGFYFTETAKKKNILSWREFISEKPFEKKKV